MTAATPVTQGVGCACCACLGMRSRPPPGCEATCGRAGSKRSLLTPLPTRRTPSCHREPSVMVRRQHHLVRKPPSRSRVMTRSQTWHPGRSARAARHKVRGIRGMRRITSCKQCVGRIATQAPTGSRCVGWCCVGGHVRVCVSTFLEDTRCVCVCVPSVLC